jgi:hypothetical protein
LSTGQAPREHAEENPAPGDDQTVATVTVRTEYTLCAGTESLQAVTAVGHVEGGPDETKPRVAYFTETLGDQDVVPGDRLISLDAGASSPLMVFVPILARLFLALDRGGADIGWSGYVVGSDIVSNMVHSIAPFVGARSLSEVDMTAPQPGFSELPGIKIFLVTGPDPGDLTKLLGVVPDGSLIASLVPHIEASHTPINFYETIHKKSLTLLGQEAHQTGSLQRAVRFATTRLDGLAADYPVLDSSSTEKLAEETTGAILRWT